MRELLDEKVPLSDSYVPSLSLDGDILALPRANEKKVLLYQLQFIDNYIAAKQRLTVTGWCTIICIAAH